MAKGKLNIVIDADVARSSGASEHPRSSSCRKTLNLVLENEHRFVACPGLLEEWRKHSSRFASTWLASMFARRRVSLVNSCTELSELVAASKVEEKVKRILLKDVHLLEAARKRGKLVASGDESARASISSFPAVRAKVANVRWANPTTEFEALSSTLLEGRHSEILRKIG